MDNQSGDDSEFQTFFPFRVSQEPQLPYHWDGDCRLVINDNMYHTPASKSLDSPRSPSFEIDMPEPYDLIKDCFDCEVESIVSSEVSASTTETACTGIVPEGKEKMALEDQLDFIMGSGKKSQKNSLKQTKHKRSKKTKEQLEILIKEWENIRGQDLDALNVEDLAEKTGLTRVQVYKWFWDHKQKEDNTS